MLNTVADIHVQTSMIGKPGTVETHGRIASSIFQKEGAFV